MKIYNKIVLDKDNNIIEEDHFEYNGPITYCGSGGESGSAGSMSAEATVPEHYTTHTTSTNTKGTNTSSSVDWSESDDLESDFSNVQSSAHYTYSAPSSDSYTGLDNEQATVHDKQHYDSWVDSQKGPDYSKYGVEGDDLEGQRVIDQEWAKEKGLITVDRHGNVSDGPNVRNDQGIIVSRNDPSVNRDLTFSEHWNNRPEAIKWSPTLSFLYASGKNIKEFLTKPGTYTAGRDKDDYQGGDSESQMMRDVAPHAPYIVSGTTKPTNSPAANWFSSSLGNTSLSGSNFSMATEYAAAKSKQQAILGSPSPVGQMAVNDSPFYNWLKDKSLNKGIL